MRNSWGHSRAGCNILAGWIRPAGWSKVISWRIPTYDSTHSWRFYSAVPLGNQANGTMTQYPTQSHYPASALTSLVLSYPTWLLQTSVTQPGCIMHDKSLFWTLICLFIVVLRLSNIWYRTCIDFWQYTPMVTFKCCPTREPGHWHHDPISYIITLSQFHPRLVRSY